MMSRVCVCICFSRMIRTVAFLVRVQTVSSCQDVCLALPCEELRAPTLTWLCPPTQLTVVPNPRPGCYDSRFPDVPDTVWGFLKVGYSTCVSHAAKDTVSRTAVNTLARVVTNRSLNESLHCSVTWMTGYEGWGAATI